MRIVFMGTPDFAVPTLEALIHAHQVVAVCTQPDRPKGRGHSVQFSPVKECAIAANIPVLQPQRLRGPEGKEARAQLRSYQADVFIVVAYGVILPKVVLAMPRYGCVNVHASILPRWRGASPIHAAIMAGDTVTGVTIMQMDAGIDTGDMIHVREIPIMANERCPALHDRLAVLGAESLLEALAQIEAKTAVYTKQGNEMATYAPMIQKTDGCIDWRWPSARIINLTRALDPWPGPYTDINGALLKIWRTMAAEDEAYKCEKIPGTVLKIDPQVGFLVRTGDGAVWVTEVQASGKKRMAASDYLRGQALSVGDVCGLPIKTTEE